MFHVRLLGCVFHCYNWLQHCPLHDFVKLDFTGWVKRKTGERYYSYIRHSQRDIILFKYAKMFYFNAGFSLLQWFLSKQPQFDCERHARLPQMGSRLRWGAGWGRRERWGGGRDGIARGELSLEARLANSIWGNGSAPTVSFDLEKTEWKRWKQGPKRQTPSHIFTFLQFRIILGPTKHVLHLVQGCVGHIYSSIERALKHWNFGPI